MSRISATLLVSGIIVFGVIVAYELTLMPRTADPLNHAPLTLRDTGAVNAVSAILFDYRALDTLGEATVILMTATVVAFLTPRAKASMLAVRLSSIVLYGVVILLPFITILGIAVMAHGHISPGGGFTGGVIVATSTVFYAVVYSVGGQQSYVIAPAANKLIENTAMTAFIGVGLLGLGLAGSFLANAQSGIPLGTPGELLSAGTIPVLNLISGVKVGVGLGIIVMSLFLE